MACEVPVERFIEIIGHDGSETVRNAPEPLNRVGHHSQECVMAAYSLGKRPVHFIAYPGHGVPGYKALPLKSVCGKTPCDAISWLMSSESGVANASNNGKFHAVAFHKGLILDPDGSTYPLISDQTPHINSIWITS